MLAGAVLAQPGVALAQRLEDLVAQANAAEQAGDLKQAARLYERAYGVSGHDPVFLYLAASSAAAGGETRAALAHLWRAVRGGFPRLDVIERDSALNGLRADPGWDSLMAEVRRRNAGHDSTLRAELVTLAEQDQRDRTGLEAIVTRYGRRSREADSAFAVLDSADAPRVRRLEALVAARGWPGISLVADDGAHAAWLIVQHAPAAVQRRLLPVVLVAARAGEARASDAAYLEDRVLVAEGQPQRYGTQMRWPAASGGTPVLEPIADEACVDRRRAAVGLEPLRSYLARHGLTYREPDAPCRN
jgi:hypothetical protein